MIKREAESLEIIKRRWDFKKEQIEILANNIQKLRYNVTLGLKDSDNEKVFLTALVVDVILETSERVGNEVSASNGRVGVCGLKKNQVSIDGNKVTLEYTGKSGVEHVKSFSDEKIAKALKIAIRHSKTDDVFCTSDGFKIKAARINNFLSDFLLRSKDIRGFSANKWMLEKLKNGEVENDEAKRKKFFMQSLRKTALKVGHGASTLRKHYLIPELETNYIKNGIIINLNERESYELGGEIENTSKEYPIDLVTDEINKAILDLGYFTKINKSKTSFGVSNYIYVDNQVDEYGNILHADKKIRISDHDVSNFDRIKNEILIFPNSKSFNLKNEINSVLNGLKYYFDRDKYFTLKKDSITKEAYNVQTNHPTNYDVITKEFVTKKGNKMYEVTRSYKIPVTKWISKYSGLVYETIEERFELGGSVENNIEFKCDYEKYFEYVPLSEIEKYIEFDREVEHKISKKYLDELTNEIKVNGITYPITLEVYGSKGLIVEGNHRVSVAKRLGIKYIPVRVFQRSRPFKGTIYEDKVKELPSSSNYGWAKSKYGINILDSDNSAAVYGFTKVEPNYEKGGELKNELLAPNGKPSNLTPEQYKLVRSPEFLSWFGNFIDDPENSSKIVDSNGEPLLVFHGSNMDFSVFKSISNNSFFSDNKAVANSYRSKYVFKEDLEIGINEKDYEEYKNDVVENSVKIYEVFLNIRNPIVKDFKGDNWLDDTIEKYFDKNHDGFIAKNIIDGANIVANTYVAFSSNQIKSSDGSNTTFEKNNSDIRFGKGGDIKSELLAPNGKKSNLNEIQYNLVRSENFIEWFGDWQNDPKNASKAIDENGEPKIMYHSSLNEFFKFDKSKVESSFRYTSLFFVSDENDISNIFANKFRENDDERSIVTTPLFVNARDIFDADIHETDKEVVEKFYKRKMISFSKNKPHESNDIDILDNWMFLEGDKFIRKNVLKNNDGIYVAEKIDGISYKSLGVFSSNQLKLADGSNTSFDVKNLDIRFENGGEISKNDNFAKWFKGSKVVDELGNPKIVYHGTNRKFNVFDSKEIGQGTGNFGHYGYGFYFSDDIREAQGYGDIVLECYLNIKKPFTGTNEEFDLLKEEGFAGIDNKVPLSIDFNDLHEKMKLVDSNAYKFMSIAKEHGIDNVWSIYLESHPHPRSHKIDLNDLYDILGYTDLLSQNNAVPSYTIEDIKSFGIEPKLNLGYEHYQSLHWVTDLGNNSKRFTDFIISLGYDGVIYGSEYVAFYPNQIKLADGTNTSFDSQNPDIRFEKGGEIINSDNFKKWFYGSKIIDDKGLPIIVYHGTNELFNKFDLSKVGSRDNNDYGMWGTGFYFSPVKKFSKAYGDKSIKVYLSVKNPFIVKKASSLPQEFKPVGGSKEKSDELRQRFINDGYDGVIQYETGDNPKITQIIAFYPEQIKLADRTNTSFDSGNPDIRFEKGGELLEEEITFDNFYKGTTADFKEILKAGVPKRKPDFVSDSGSKYWFTSNSVIRQSDHWGRLDSCIWTLDHMDGYRITQGICQINNFSK